ncbi:MAG: YceI family protein [Porticoccaceae bacterium]
MKKPIILALAAFTLVACSEAPEPASAPAADERPAVGEQPAAQEQAAQPSNTLSSAQMAAAEPAQIHISAPAGQYKIDPDHASLAFSVTHLGVSNYVMRFTDYDVTLDLNPDDLAASSVTVTIDPASIDTDFAGDYQGTHPDSPFSSWEQDLAMSENFLNAGKYDSISFTSTSVSPSDDGTLLITGDLNLLGQTRPVTLEATVVGSEQAHPFSGVGLIGFSATGTFNRSDFGMTHLLNPPLVGDVVTLHFEGELQQQVEQTQDQNQDSDET